MFKKLFSSNRISNFIFLQFSVIIYSSAGVISKCASAYPVMSMPFILLYMAEIAILGIYAIIWQQIIKKIDISVAYANKGTALLWSLVWAILLFKETITPGNIAGVIIVTIGVIIINSDKGGNQ